MALTEQAHQRVREHFLNKPKTLAIDATCGNGHDTEFLAQLGFAKVLAFDVQKQALDATRHRISTGEFDSVALIHDGHQNMNIYIDAQVDCLMFNFGYLPSADKTKTTQADTSIKALEIATNHLSQDGLITLLCYPGHPAGAIETKYIQNFLADLSDYWCVETHLSHAPKPTSPILFFIKRTQS